MGDRCFVTLKSVARSIDDGDWIESKDQSNNGIRLLQVGNIGNGFYVEKGSNARYISESTFSKLKCKEVLEGDILISRLPAPVGRACLVPFSQEKRITAVDCTIVRLKESVCNKRYLLHFLRSPEYFRQIESLIAGSTRKRISRKNLEQIQLPLPPLPIQQKIADALDKASALIEMRKTQIEKLDLLIKSQFIEMFGDPVTNPKGWKTKRLIDVTRKIGSGATPTGGRNTYIDAGISLIRSMNVHNGEFRYDQLAHIDDEQAKQLENVNVEIHDVLLNITGASVARCCVVPDNVLPARVNQHVSIIRTGNVLNYIYLNNLMTNESFQEHLLRIGSYGGATREALTKKDIEELVIPIPPEHLQKKYADLVSNIIVEKSRLRESLDMFDNKYKSLMQKCFNGDMFNGI